MWRLAYILGVLLLISGCSPKSVTSVDAIIRTAEEGVLQLKANPPSAGSFQLRISDSLTFAGKPDTTGAGMAIILDKILGLGYLPDGFEQKEGFKLYRYKKMQ